MCRTFLSPQASLMSSFIAIPTILSPPSLSPGNHKYVLHSYSTVITRMPCKWTIWLPFSFIIIFQRIIDVFVVHSFFFLNWLNIFFMCVWYECSTFFFFFFFNDSPAETQLYYSQFGAIINTTATVYRLFDNHKSLFLFFSFFIYFYYSEANYFTIL